MIKMFDDIMSFFSDIDGNQLMVVGIMWIVIALVLLKAGFWSIGQKIFLIIMMLPIIFFIVKLMGNR